MRRESKRAEGTDVRESRERASMSLVLVEGKIKGILMGKWRERRGKEKEERG